MRPQVNWLLVSVIFVVGLYVVGAVGYAGSFAIESPNPEGIGADVWFVNFEFAFPFAEFQDGVFGFEFNFPPQASQLQVFSSPFRRLTGNGEFTFPFQGAFENVG